MNQFEREVYGVLLKQYLQPEWCVLNQVKTNTGTKGTGGGERYIDFFIINMYPSKDYQCIAIEAKQSIADFRNDIKEPRKQMAARFYSDKFFYLFPKEMYEANDAEIDKLASKEKFGVMLYNGQKVNVRYQTGWNKVKSPFPMGLICSLVRNAWGAGNEHDRKQKA